MESSICVAVITSTPALFAADQIWAGHYLVGILVPMVILFVWSLVAALMWLIVVAWHSAEEPGESASVPRDGELAGIEDRQ